MAACLEGSCTFVRSGYIGAARSRSSGRLRRRSSGSCGRSEVVTSAPGQLLRCGQVPADMEAFSAGYVKFLLDEAVQDSIDGRVHDIDVWSDSDDEGEFGGATAELVRGLVQQRAVETRTQPGDFADVAVVPQAFPEEPCQFSFDEDVMSLVSDDDDPRENFYDQVAEFYVKAAVDYATCAAPGVASSAAALAPAARRLASAPDVLSAMTEEQLDLMDVSITGMHEEEEEEEADQQEVVMEPDIADFVLDYVCDLIDSGIAETSQGSASMWLPCAEGLAACARPPPSPVHHCPSCKVDAVPVEAEILPADCLETALLAPASLPASRPVEEEFASVRAGTSKVAASRPPSSPASMTKSRRHLVIGGVVRGPALEEHAAKSVSTPAASLQLGSKAAASSSVWRMDLGKEDSGARSSSLARSYETLGASQFYRMDTEDSLPGSRSGSRAGSPAWCFRRSAGTASAMALDLGQATPCTFGSRPGFASASHPKPVDGFCQDASWSIKKSSSSGALPRHAVSKSSNSSSSSSSKLPALVGRGSRPASPAALTAAGWTVSSHTRLGRLDRLQYAF